MHYLPGAHFLVKAEENRLWKDLTLQDTAASMWQQISGKYKNVGSILRYEILNEAVAPEHEMVNILNRKKVLA